VVAVDGPLSPYYGNRVTKPTGRPVGRPPKPEQERARERISVCVRPGAKEMLRKVGRHTDEELSPLIRRYIAEGLSRDADKLT
jgi:hypothetical protein